LTAAVHYSEDAESDLDGVAQYTSLRWSEEQAERYLTKLRDACRMLANSPGLGRKFSRIRPDMRRFEVGRHVVFFRVLEDGIFVFRILHQRMLPEKYLN
jgi:toxin ParE1/3/4